MYSLDINFLKDRGLDTATDRERKVVKRQAPIAEKIPIGVGLVLAIAFPLLSWNYVRGFEARQAEAEQKIQELDAQIAKKQGETKSLEEMEQQLQQAKTETQALVGVFDKIRPWSAILQEVSDRTPPGVQVDSLAQSGSGDNLTVQINGTARSYNDVNDFVLFLQRSPFFNQDQIILGNANSSDLPIEIANEEELPDNVLVSLPKGVTYNISAQLKNIPTSELLQELNNKGSVGLVTRLKTLEQKGAITK